MTFKEYIKDSPFLQIQLFMLLPLAMSWGVMPWWVFFAPTIAGVLVSTWGFVGRMLDWYAKP